MRPYRVGEDCLVLEAASIIGIHRRKGKNGDLCSRCEDFCKVYRRLCDSQGMACIRTTGSLKMRLYRLFSAGVMKWGPTQEKRQVCDKHKSPLTNVGTEQQKALREELLARLFFSKDGSYCLAKTTRRKSRKRLRKSRAARKPLHVPRMLKEQEDLGVSYAIASPLDSPEDMLEKQDNVSVQAPIATPLQSNIVQPVGLGVEQRELEAHHSLHTAALPKSYGFAGKHESANKAQKGELPLLVLAYKENMKTFRDCLAMKHDTIEYLKSECEKHRAFLNTSLETLFEQQERLLDLMKTKAECEEK